MIGLAQHWNRIGVVIAATLFLTACGTPTALNIAEAYVSASNADEAVTLFADNAIKVDVNGVEFSGKDQIRRQLTGAFNQISYGELVEAPHLDGDHVTWVRVNFDRLAGRASHIRQSIWVADGKIVRFTGNFAGE